VYPNGVVTAKGLTTLIGPPGTPRLKNILKTLRAI